MLMVPTKLPAIRAAIDEAAAMTRSTEAMLRQTTQDRAARFVADLYLMRNAERETQLYRARVVPAARQLVSSSRNAYAAGTIVFADLIDSERMFISGRRMVAQAQIEREQRLAELESLAGVDIETLGQHARADIPAAASTARAGAGTVLQKTAFAGQYVTVQDDLFVVADLSTVWMQAKIFQYELPHVAIGMPATVSFPASSQRTLTGKVVFIDPAVDEASRSVQVRIELPNPHGTLLPGMFGDVVISHAMGSGLTIPTSAVIRTGERDIAFRVVSAGRFAPVVVKIGPTRFADRFEVLEGLKAGDEVVTSGNFLIDSESRLEAGAGAMADMPGMVGPAKSEGPKASDKK